MAWSPDAVSTHSPGRRRPTRRHDAAVVEHHLRHLGSDDLAALVVDLWTDRGFETSRDGRLVVATRDRTTERIAVVGRRRLGTPSLPASPTDVVVTPGGASVDPPAEDHRTLDAGDLREMLFYAVDRPTSRRLCERHLGDPPEQLRPPLPTRLRHRSRTVASRVTPALVVGLFVLLGLGAVAGVAFTAEGGGQRGSLVTSQADASAAPAATNGSTLAPPYRRPVSARPEPAGSNGPGGAVRSPPGVTDSGIANLTALAAAHERVLTDRSYTLRLEPAQPVKALWDGDRRTVRIAVDGDRYLLAETKESRPVRELYYDGSTLQVATFDESGTIETVRQRQPESSADGPGPNPFELRETLFTQYLSTPETTVTARFSERNRTVTRIVASGAPAGIEAERVLNYTAIALVDDRGVLRNLTVEYTPDTRPPDYTIRLEARYRTFGETTVRSPWWHERTRSTSRGPPSTENSGDR
jgi:hypothetical protein